jgi:hypothetical protein
MTFGTFLVKITQAYLVAKTCQRLYLFSKIVLEFVMGTICRTGKILAS